MKEVINLLKMHEMRDRVFVLIGGAVTTDLVRRVIAQGTAQGIPVARPRKVDGIVNARTARRLGIALDPVLTKQAIEVVR